MQVPAQEWQDAFRRARNATLSWTLITVVAVTYGVGVQADFDSRGGGAVFFVVSTAVTVALYGLWRLGRLLVIRHDLQHLGQPLGRVYLALVDSPLYRNTHEAVLIWMTDPRVDGRQRLRRPDRCFMADLSEDDRTDEFGKPVIYEAWTPVRVNGRLRRGRWFCTADNLVLTVRRGGPFAWLMTRRGFSRYEGIVGADQPDMSGFVGLDRPVGFAGFTSALLWRLLGAGALGAIGMFAR